jgi:NhaP-type Na+/H+ or K+/H+ antiporter
VNSPPTIGGTLSPGGSTGSVVGGAVGGVIVGLFVGIVITAMIALVASRHKWKSGGKQTAGTLYIVLSEEESVVKANMISVYYIM